MKISKSLATALVKAWMADAKVFRLSDDLLEELSRHGYAGYKWTVRVLLASKARGASDLCWASKFKSAVLWLVKHGLEHNGETKYLREAVGNSSYYEERHRKDRDEVAERYRSHRRSEQWGTCK